MKIDFSQEQRQEVQNTLNNISNIFNMLLINIGDFDDFNIYANEEKEILINLITKHIEQQTDSCINVADTLPKI